MTDRDIIEQIIIFAETLSDDTEFAFDNYPNEYTEGKWASALKVKSFIKDLVGEVRYKEITRT